MSGRGKVPGKAWKPADATDHIRRLAAGNFNLMLTMHAKEQMESRGLATGDILHVLKTGFVYDDGEPSTRDDLYKYKMDGRSPNQEARVIRIVVIPSTKPSALKIITVMWKDGI